MAVDGGQAATETGRPPAVFQTFQVLTLAACHFIHDIYSSFLAPLLPLLIEKLSMSLTLAGSLTAVMQLPALLNPFIGRLADRINVRLFVVLAPVLTAVPMSLIGLAPSYGVLVVLLLVAGLSTALFHVPAPVMVAGFAGPKVGMGMSFFMTGGELARTLGPMIAVGAVAVFGLEGFYPVMIVGILASFWLHLRFRHVQARSGSRSTSSMAQTWRDMRHVLVPLIGILVGRAFMHASMSTFLPTFVAQETGDLWLAGISLAFLEGMGVVGALTAGILSDRIGRRKVLLGSLIGAPLGIALFVSVGGWLRVLALLITGFTLLSTTPVMLAVVQENAKDSPAAANGFFMMSSFLARSAIVIPVGIMGDLIGLRTAYVISACLGLLTIPFIFRLPAAGERR